MSKVTLWDLDWNKLIEERFGVEAETISKYADAHKAGKALTVPCRPGDTLYQIDNGPELEELICHHIEIMEDEGELYPVVYANKPDFSGGAFSFYPESFGLYVFTDRNIAVAALRRKLRCGMCISGEFQQYNPEGEKWEYNKK